MVIQPAAWLIRSFITSGWQSIEPMLLKILHYDLQWLRMETHLTHLWCKHTQYWNTIRIEFHLVQLSWKLQVQSLHTCNERPFVRYFVKRHLQAALSGTIGVPNIYIQHKVYPSLLIFASFDVGKTWSFLWSNWLVGTITGRSFLHLWSWTTIKIPLLVLLWVVEYIA